MGKLSYTQQPYHPDVDISRVTLLAASKFARAALLGLGGGGEGEKRRGIIRRRAELHRPDTCRS